MLRLIFTPHGTAELYEGKQLLWNSDTDEDFIEEFSDRDSDDVLFLGAGDDEEIMSYLVEKDLVGDDVEYSVIEQSLNDAEQTEESDD